MLGKYKLETSKKRKKKKKEKKERKIRIYKKSLSAVLMKKLIFFIKNFDFFLIYDNINIYVLNVSKHVLEYVCL